MAVASTHLGTRPLRKLFKRFSVSHTFGAQLCTAMAMAPPLVLVVHAFGGSPRKFWYEWLASELGERAEVDVMSMTEPRTPTIANWVADLERRVEAEATSGADAEPRELYLVGHSVGCQTIVRFLATPGAPELLAASRLRLRGSLCVAAWFAVVDPWETIEPWCSTPIDCGAVRDTLGQLGCPLHVLLSDNDKYTPDYQANGEAWCVELGAEPARLVPDRAHFGGKKQPEILSAVLGMLQGISSPHVPPPALREPAASLLSPPQTAAGKLPTDLLAMVLGRLDAASLCRAEQVSRGWHAAARGDASTADRGGWSIVFARDYPAVPGAATAGGSGAQLMYRLACVQRQCIRCHKKYHVGHNTATACGFHHGVIISGHRDNGMRARWTCCGKWGPTRAGGSTELLASEAFCSFTRHLGSLTTLNTPEDVGACGAAEKGAESEGIARHKHRLAHTASDPDEAGPVRSSTYSVARAGGGGQDEGTAARRDGSDESTVVNGVRRSLVDEMLHARSVAASQSVSWLGCGE